MVGSLNKIWPWKITDTELVNGVAFDVEKNVLPNTFEQVNGSDPLSMAGNPHVYHWYFAHLGY